MDTKLLSYERISRQKRIQVDYFAGNWVIPIWVLDWLGQDLSNVAQAECYINDQGEVVFKCEITNEGWETFHSDVWL